MKIELTQVFGFEAAIRAMRNPWDSWGKSDSLVSRAVPPKKEKNYNPERFLLGAADAKLSRDLTAAGPEHAKHLRMIMVWVDLTLPRYIWAEMDTYQHTVKVSCSTMHKLKSRPIQAEDFEGAMNPDFIDVLNCLIEDEFPLETVKNQLPEGYLQKRTFMTSYAQLLNIRRQRRTHGLKPWHKIADWIDDLPYFPELTGVE